MPPLPCPEREGLISAFPPLAAIAAQILGWRPDEFWRATPAELALSLGAGGDDTALPTPAEFARLKEQFPDG